MKIIIIINAITRFAYFNKAKMFQALLKVILLLFSQSVFTMEQQMPPAQVSITLASERLLAPTMQISGSVISVNDATISAQISGELQWLAEVGSNVNEGDTIARMDVTLFKLNLQSVEAQLKKLQADLAFRQQELKRFSILADRDNTSRAQLQEETSKRNMLLQDIQTAKSDIEKARYYLSKTHVKAPFTGHIVKRLASKGEYLSVGQEVIQLVDTVNREIRINAPLELLPILQKQSEVSEVEVVAYGEHSKAAISAIVPVGDAISRMFEVRLTIADEQMIPGMPVTVSLPSAIPLNRVTIPRDSLIIKGSDVYIYRIDDSMKSERIEADIVAISGPWVAIKHKLFPGDKIVTRGGERLMPGQTVSILEN